MTIIKFNDFCQRSLRIMRVITVMFLLQQFDPLTISLSLSLVLTPDSQR